jgi:hypothetical protein
MVRTFRSRPSRFPVRGGRHFKLFGRRDQEAAEWLFDEGCRPVYCCFMTSRTRKDSLLYFTGIVVTAMNVVSAQTIVTQTEPNDSFGTATATGLVPGEPGGVISFGNNGDGPFGPTSGDGSGDFDFFAIDAAQGQTIIIDVDGRAIGRNLDTIAAFYNASGAVVESNDDDGTTTDSFLRFTVPTAGVYYGVVGSWVSGGVAENLPSDPEIGGNGVGSPGGGVDDYEVAVGIDMPAYLTASPLIFPLIGRDEKTEGSVTLTNAGLEAAAITGFNITGADADSFAVGVAAPLSIGAGASVVVPIAFDPKGSNDERLAVLEIVSNDIVRPMRSLALRGKAIDGLVLRLGFDDPDGSPIGSFSAPLDLSGNGFQAAYVANSADPEFARPSLVGDGGFSVRFDDGGGTANYVLTANGFPHTATVSYSLWIRPDTGSGVDSLFNRDPGFSTNDSVFGLGLLEDGSLRFRIQGSEVLLTEPEMIEDEQVYHVVVTHLDSDGFDTGNADRTRLYVNGALVAEETDTLEFPLYPEQGAANTRLWIATQSAAGTGYSGDMDDFQVYNVELTPEEVKGMFDNPGSIASEAPSAPLQFTSISYDATVGEVTLTWASKPNANYILEYSPDLNEPWLEADDSIESGGELTTAKDSGISPDVAVRYYRVRQ